MMMMIFVCAKGVSDNETVEKWWITENLPNAYARTPQIYMLYMEFDMWRRTRNKDDLN